MNHKKYLKSAIKVVLFVAIVLSIEHTVYYSMELYEELPKPCKRIETFDNFVFIVSPKAESEVAGLSCNLLYVARIRTNELSGQTYKDVLENKSGPIEIIGKTENHIFEKLNIMTDLSFFKIQTESDLKNSLKNEGYIKGEEIFPEFKKPITGRFLLDFHPISFPIDKEKHGYRLYLLTYNDKYIRICNQSTEKGSDVNFDFIYTVDDNKINMIRNIQQIYF